MKNSILVFDFDGTIADTFENLLRISNTLSAEFNYSKIEPNEVEELKNKSSQEIIEYLGVPIMKIPTIVAKAKNKLHHEMAFIKPVAGLKEILLKLKSFGFCIGILSSNSQENVMKFLKKHHLDFFDFITTTSKIWSKNTSLKKLMVNLKADPAEVIYIGDETRDILAAKKAGVKVIAVTWGYNSSKALKALQPDYLVHSPEDLMQCVNS